MLNLALEVLRDKALLPYLFPQILHYEQGKRLKDYFIFDSLKEKGLTPPHSP